MGSLRIALLVFLRFEKRAVPKKGTVLNFRFFEERCMSIRSAQKYGGMVLSEVRWIDLPHVPDERGVLTSIESGLDIPFDIRRIFFMHAIRGERGGHAHRVTRQLLLPVAGEFNVHVSDGSESATYPMADPNRALYLPPMTWIRLFEFAPDAVCLVLADTHYVDDTYIHDWDEFLRTTRPA